MSLSELGTTFAQKLLVALRKHEVSVLKVNIKNDPSSQEIFFNFDNQFYAQALMDAIKKKYNVTLRVHQHNRSRDEKFALVYSHSLTTLDALLEATKDSKAFNASIQEIAKETKASIASTFNAKPLKPTSQHSLLRDIFSPAGTMKQMDAIPIKQSEEPVIGLRSY